jgi:hypothetical protein
MSAIGTFRTSHPLRRMSAFGGKADLFDAAHHVRFSNRPSGVKHIRLSTTAVSMSLTGSCFSSESAPVALPSWDSRTRRNNLMGGLPSTTAGPSGHTISPHPVVPRGTSFHRSVELACSPIAFDPMRFSCRCDLPGPAELGAVNPDAVHNHSQPACQCHDGLFHAAAPGDLHRPGLEPRPPR